MSLNSYFSCLRCYGVSVSDIKLILSDIQMIMGKTLLLLRTGISVELPATLLLPGFPNFMPVSVRVLHL